MNEITIYGKSGTAYQEADFRTAYDILRHELRSLHSLLPSDSLEWPTGGGT